MDTHLSETRPFVINLESSQPIIPIIPNKPRKYKLWIIIGSIFIFVIVLLLLLFYKFTHTENTHTENRILLIDSISFDNNDLLDKWENSKVWNIVKYVYGRDFLFNENDTIKAIYPKGSWSPSSGSLHGYGGFDFYVQPIVFPYNEICFQYDIKFASNFEWVKGGKLPGLWIGDIGASGGNHINYGYSYRVAWKQYGQVEAYLYIPTNQSQDLILEPEYIKNDLYGDSLWRGFTNFTKDKWYTITMYIKLNTFSKNTPIISPNYDGIISLKINNTTRIYNKLVWSTKSNLLINGIMMDSFFGGSDVSYATINTTYIYFNNFKVSRFKCS